MINLIVLFSGKRKSGKDFVSARLAKELKTKYTVRLASVSHSLKAEYARIHSLRLDDLLSDGPYKELYRHEMIKWGEEKRREDPEYFCRETIPMEVEKVDVLIITDCRRPTDVAFYQSHFKNVITVRVESTIEARIKRGFVFDSKVDEAASECALDDFVHDMKIENSGDPAVLDSSISLLIDKISTHLG